MTHGLSIGDYRYASLWDGCIGAWCPSATGPGGDILADRSATQRHGILTSMDPATDWTADGDGFALDFDGTNDHVVLPSYADYSDMTETTVACWVYARSSGTDIAYLWCGTTSNTPILWLLGPTAAGLRMFVRNDAASSATATGGLVLTNEWMHVAGVRSSAGLQVYRNGVQTASSATVITGSISVTTAYIGARLLAGINDDFTDGMLDDVRVYNRALDPGEIRLLGSRRGVAYERRIRRWVKAPASPPATNGNNLLLLGVG